MPISAVFLDSMCRIFAFSAESTAKASRGRLITAAVSAGNAPSAGNEEFVTRAKHE